MTHVGNQVSPFKCTTVTLNLSEPASASLLRVLLIVVSSLDAGRPSLMRLTHIAPSAKLAALFPARRSSRAPLPISQAGSDLAVPALADPAHAVAPPDSNAAAVEFLLQRPRGEQHAGMASLANGRQRWADLVGRLLPGTSPDQQRLRDAMLAVDRACFVEPSTPEALVYEVCVGSQGADGLMRSDVPCSSSKGCCLIHLS